MAAVRPSRTRWDSRAWAGILHAEAVIVAALTWVACAPAEPAEAQAPPAGRVVAIELDGGTSWLGTDQPLRLRELRGKIVILEFWTSC